MTTLSADGQPPTPQSFCCIQQEVGKKRANQPTSPLVQPVGILAHESESVQLDHSHRRGIVLTERFSVSSARGAPLFLLTGRRRALASAVVLVFLFLIFRTLVRSVFPDVERRIVDARYVQPGTWLDLSLWSLHPSRINLVWVTAQTVVTAIGRSDCPRASRGMEAIAG